MKVTDFTSVEGKVAIVTGGLSGIGLSIAKKFTDNGMKVVIADIQDDRADSIIESICKDSGDAIYYHTDMSDEESVANCTKKALEVYGQLNVMVNCAGVGSSMHPVHEFSTEEFKRVIDIDYIGTFYGMKHAVKAMLASKALKCSIINIGSASGLMSSSNYSAYDSAKAAVIRLTRTAGLDYAKHDITVNIICPGTIETEIYNNLSPEQLAYSIAGVPMGRFGQPEEIANMALYLASDLARFITSSVISIDGGMTAGGMMEVPWEKPDPRI